MCSAVTPVEWLIKCTGEGRTKDSLVHCRLKLETVEIGTILWPIYGPAGPIP